MKQPDRPTLGMWRLYKMGGITPALSSMINPQNAQHMAFMRQVMKQQRTDFVMDRQLTELDVVVFDLETTGFSPNAGDEIISFGAVAVKGHEIHPEETFYMVVNPGRPIPDHIVELTGISNEEASKAPTVAEGLSRFFEFTHKRMLVAHASGHDKKFLNASLWRTSKVHMTHRVLDTLMVAKWLEPQRDNYTLDSLLADHRIPIGRRHHALDDSLATAKLWVSLLKQVQQKNIHTLGDLYAYLSQD
ncbi:exonuclease domain-containing protein [Paenibacillus thermotolerans]|uniref:exonuclease domain-containing protein n=1 Tax=Paenibacillus thermotolerans TaxID=3027807 RepID=UPI0023676D35|nr:MULTISPECIES: exonuclease domain-containing protein [unclassified Paenibacillus]